MTDRQCYVMYYVITVYAGNKSRGWCVFDRNDAGMNQQQLQQVLTVAAVIAPMLQNTQTPLPSNQVALPPVNQPPVVNQQNAGQSLLPCAFLFLLPSDRQHRSSDDGTEARHENSRHCCVLRCSVRTDPGKSWNFIVQNSRPWKVLENGIGPGKSWKVFEL